MDPTPKRKRKSIPFQTLTRNRSRALALKQQPTPTPTVSVVLKKLSPSQYTKNSSPSPTQRQRISSPTKKQENSALSSLPSTSKNNVPNSVPGKNCVTSKKTVLKKTASGKDKKTVSKRKVTNKKSKISHSSPDQVRGDSKNFGECTKQDETINFLQNRIKMLEENETSVLKRLSIYESFGFSRHIREEENYSLMMEKLTSQERLSSAERELQAYLEREENEIKMLIQKKKILKRKLSKKMEECIKEDAKEEENLRKIKEKTEKFKKDEAKFKIECEELEKELAILEERVAEEKEEFKLRPKEVPVEEPVQGPCKICEELMNKIKDSKNMLKEAKEENPALKQKVFDSAVQLKDNACEIAHHSYEIEYIKKRILLEWQYQKNEECVKERDFENRRNFSIQVCDMMEKNFSSKKYKPVPSSVRAMPKSENERLSVKYLEEGYPCCLRFPLHSYVCRRFFCGKGQNENDKMTEEERIKYEKSDPPELYKFPGRIETEEGKKIYIDKIVQYIINRVPIDKLITIQ